MFKEFKEFIMRGNIVELATAVIIAGAFGAIVTSFTNDILLPPIGLLLGNVDFSDLKLVLQPGEVGATGEVLQEEVAIRYGAFLQVILDFLIIAAAIFLLLKAYNATQKKAEAAPTAPPEEIILLRDIRDLLSKR